VESCGDDPDSLKVHLRENRATVVLADNALHVMCGGCAYVLLIHLHWGSGSSRVQVGGGRLERKYPSPLGPVFPPGPAHYHATVDAWVARAGVIDKQADFDGWVARVTQPRLLDFIAFCYGEQVTESVERLISLSVHRDASRSRCPMRVSPGYRPNSGCRFP